MYGLSLLLSLIKFLQSYRPNGVVLLLLGSAHKIHNNQRACVHKRGNWCGQKSKKVGQIMGQFYDGSMGIIKESHGILLGAAGWEIN